MFEMHNFQSLSYLHVGQKMAILEALKGGLFSLKVVQGTGSSFIVKSSLVTSCWVQKFVYFHRFLVTTRRIYQFLREKTGLVIQKGVHCSISEPSSNPKEGDHSSRVRR